MSNFALPTIGISSIRLPRWESLWLKAILLSLLIPAAAHGTVDEMTNLLRSNPFIAVDSDPALSVELDWPTLRTFYRHNDYRPLWFDETGRLPRAEQLMQILRAAGEHGLEPTDYHTVELDLLWQADALADRLLLELLLTDALARYAGHLQSGRLAPQTFDSNWNIATTKADPVDLLVLLINAGDFSAALSSLPPPHSEYQRLRLALAEYRQLAATGGWAAVPKGPILKLGIQDERVPLLRNRLIASGDLMNVQWGKPLLFDEVLDDAVRRFQQRHGISEDGVVGTQTLAAMNVPIEQRIDEIKLNMERWRWLPRSLGDNYILVNTAAFHLRLIESGNQAIVMRVIVGKPERPTPSIHGDIYSLVFNPTWTLPKTIVVEDIVPRQLEDPYYLQSRNIRVYDGTTQEDRELDPAAIDWRQVNENYQPYRLVQAPGPSNSLGNIKFKLTNDFEVFLHDTPGRALFTEPARAFSSGCIRLEQPLQLADYLLQGENGWELDKIQEVIESGQTLEVKLPKPIPVYLVYLTAWVGTNGEVNFVNDIYDLDRELVLCM